MSGAPDETARIRNVTWKVYAMKYMCPEIFTEGLEETP